MKRGILLLLLMIVALVTLGQAEYIKNFRVIPASNKIYFQYDLRYNTKKKYSEENEFMKVRKFNIELSYSLDNGVSYNLLKDTKGDIGRKILNGKSKTIIYKPRNTYGLIGNIKYRITSEPIIPKTTFAIGYLGSFCLSNSDINTFGEYFDNRYSYKTYNYHQLSLNLYRLKNKGCFYYTLKTAYSTYSNCEVLTYTLGIGKQTKRRKCSINFGLGFGHEIREQSFFGLAFDTGIDFKIIDTNAFTFLIPISFNALFNGGNASINSGLLIQL